MDLFLTAKAKDEMHCAERGNGVVAHASAVFQLSASVDQALLVRRNAFLGLNIVLHGVDGGGGFGGDGDGLASERLHPDGVVVVGQRRSSGCRNDARGRRGAVATFHDLATKRGRQQLPGRVSSGFCGGVVDDFRELECAVDQGF